MESINSFEGGLNSDFSKSVQKKNTYIDALNVQLTTDAGGTNGALINFKGNKSFVTISNTQPVYKILANTVVDTDPITINATASAGTFTTSTTTTGQDIYDFISTDANLSAAGFGTSWKVAIGPNYVIVWGVTIDPNPTSVHTGLTITTVVAAQTNLDLIGWGQIREDIVLFTTNNTSSTGGYGQIWKLVYDKAMIKNSGGAPTVQLIYNNDIKFTKQKPIVKLGQTVGRYENSTIQRIYWTDNFNPLRKLNIADVNAMALDPSELEVATPVAFSTPILNKINDNGGSVKTGMYQLAYRLKNTSGAITTFSDASNLVILYNSLSTDPFWNTYYSGTSSTSLKSITWDISGLDVDFDSIEVAVIYKTTEDGLPDINIVAEEPIPADGTFSFTYTGLEDHVPLDLTEYTAFSSVFTHCKTIESKDNILFAGNLRNDALDIDFDCRAYRFTSSNTGGGNDRLAKLRATYIGSQVITLDANPGPPLWSSVPETHAAIQTYTDQCDYNPTTGSAIALADSYRFQSDGATLGGEGPNIKYTFAVNTDIIGDYIPSSFGSNTITSPFGFDSRQVGPTSGNYTLNGVSYPGNSHNHARNPYTHNLFKGYYREEMYRFAIVFYDKQGRPGPARWIADIKMPRHFERDNASPAVDTTTYVHTDLGGFSSTQRVKHLGVIFTIDWTNLSTTDRAKIGGYSIVRCKRTQSDKHILGTGIIFPTIRDGSDSKNYYTKPNGGQPFENTDDAYVDATNAAWTPSRNKIGFDCPDFTFDQGFSGASSGNDYINICGVLNDTASATGGSGTHQVYFKKMYTITNTGSYRQSRSVTDATAVTKGAQNAGPAADFNNGVKQTQALAYPSRSQTFSNGTVFINLGANMNYDTGGLIAGTYDKYYAVYFRNLTTQYGGFTYNQKSNSEYIGTGHFTKITDVSDFATTDTVTVYGGDCFIPVIDHQKGYATYGYNTTDQLSSVVYYWPIETKYSYEFRAGNTVCRNGIAGTGSGVLDLGESQVIYNVTSAENDIRKYYPVSNTSNTNTEFDTRIAFSQIKINGELVDSWGIFKTNDFYDLESIHGPLNNLIVVNDRMLGWQPLGFCNISVNPTSVIQDTSGTELQLGTGATINSHDYITTEGGSKHQWGMARSHDSVYWFDAMKHKIWKFSGEGLMPLSDLKGLHGWINEILIGQILTTDNPVYQHPTYGTTELGITATYDFENNRVFFTFLDSVGNLAGDVWTSTKNTISYNEQFDCFESWHSFYPTMYVNDGHIILTRNPTSVSTYKQLYIHNLGNYGSYYGTVYDSTVTMLLNEAPVQTKVFDNLEWHTEVIDKTGTNPVNKDTETFTQLRVYNDYQNTNWQTLTNNTNINRKERTWKLAVPRNRVLYTTSASPDIFTDLNSGNKTYGERIRDKYAILGLKFSNTNNRALTFHWLKYLFRQSAR